MKLILSGGGSGEKSIEMDRLFSSIINKSKPLLYIPIAIDNIKHPYPECLIWLKKTFDALGVRLYEMWIEEDLPKSKVTEPEKFGGIYIGGGNTFYLTKILKETPFWEFLIEALKKNIPVYGGSAGAIIFGKSILSSSDENSEELKDFSGMNLLKSISIFCHYKPEKEEKINERLKLLNRIIALSERTGIYIHDKTIKIIGQEPAILFSNKDKKEINVGETLN